LNCFIQIPNNAVINAIQDILINVDASTKLSTDVNLKKIIQLFKENVYSATDESKKIKKDTPVVKEVEDSDTNTPKQG